MAEGYQARRVRIKADAVPIDNETKWAWDDSDYEEVEVWREYTEDELAMMDAVTTQDLADALAEASEAVSAAAEDLATVNEAIAELSALVSALSENGVTNG